MTKVHATETPLGHLQRHHAKRGTVVRYHRNQATRLSDELVPPRRPIEPVVGGWREVFEVLAGIVVMGLFGLAFVVWMSLAAVAS